MSTVKRENKLFWKRIAISIVLIFVFLSACNLPWKRSPSEPLQTTETEIPVTPKARLDLPPTLVESTPIPGSEISLSEEITFTFNQAMDKASVEGAIQASPTLSGIFSWEEDATVTFIPDKPFMPNSDLEITITVNAKAINGKNLLYPVQINYHVSGNLKLTSMLPFTDSDDVDPSSAIVAAFNQAVVGLGQENVPAAFTVQPVVAGHAEWINTSTYIFYPEPCLSGGSTYTITLNNSLASLSGAPLDDTSPTMWQFNTAKPEVLSVSPEIDMLKLDGPIVVEFNMRMDAESVNNAFALLDPQDNSIPGDFIWDDSETELSFIPRSNLQRNMNYTMHLSSSAASYGGIPLEESYTQTFLTYPVFSFNGVTDNNFESFASGAGRLEVYFKTPLDRTTYIQAIEISPEVPALRVYLSDKDTTLNISGYFKAASQYTLTLSENLQDVWGEHINQGVSFTFHTPNAKPSFFLQTGQYDYAYGLAFSPAGESKLLAQATNITYLNVEIGKMSYEEFIWYVNPDSYEGRSYYVPADQESYTEYYTLTPNENEVVSIPLRLNRKDLTPGIYFISVNAPQAEDPYGRRSQDFILVVSRYNTVMKLSSDQAFVWVYSFDNNMPLANADVTILSNDGTSLTKGKTDINGIFTSEIPHQDSSYKTYFAIIGHPDDIDGFSLASSTWGSTFLYWDLGLSVDFSPQDFLVYTYTERPIYRPGQEVFFKSIIRKVANSQYTLPQDEPFLVEVYGESGIGGDSPLLYSAEQSLTDYGTLAGEFTLPDSAYPGYYRIAISTDDEILDTVYFEVANYRKPEIELEISLTPEEIRYDEDLQGSVQADYYFGVPASNLEVTWVLYANEEYFHLPGYRVGSLDTRWMLPSFIFDNYGYFGTQIVSGSGKTGPDGHLTIDLPSNQLHAIDLSGYVELILEVTITDESGLPISQRANALMHPDDFYIGVRPKSYFGAAEEPFEFDILTVDWEKTPSPKQPIEAEFSQITWKIDGYQSAEMAPNYVAVEKLIGSASPITSSQGEARVAFTPPEPGSYQLTMRSGEAETQVLIWVSGSSAAVWPRLPNNKIELIADAETYQAGQIANIFIPNPFPQNTTALITLERGEVMHSEVVNIQGAGLTYNVRMSDAEVPNVYFSVIVLGKNEQGLPDYRQGCINLPVSPLNQILDVSVTVNPGLTVPGGEVSMVLEVTDRFGNPVQGEFSTAIIDKAILALADPKELPIADAFYGNQPISVISGLSIAGYATQMSLQPLPVGGGGGGDSYPLFIREDFPDTAYWNANIVTGSDGKAVLTIPLPDNLTTWQINVRGITEETEVGEATAEIITQKDLMVRPQTPRFLVADDHLSLMAIVHNTTSVDLNTEVSLQAIGFQLDDLSQQTQMIIIPAKSNVTVTWWGRVESIDEVKLVFSAKSGKYQDASRPIWGNLPVLRYVTPMSFSTAGILSSAGSRLEVISIPSSFTPLGGELRLELTPSLAAALVDGLKALETDVYDDNISLLARLLPNIETYFTFQELGIESPSLQIDLEQEITIALRELFENQSYDGGWRWVTPRDRSTPSNPFITAYILIGLERVTEAGFQISKYTHNSARDFLRENIKFPTRLTDVDTLNELCFEVYALQGDINDSYNVIDTLYQQRSKLSPWASAMLTLTLHDIYENDPRITTLLSDLESSAIRSATGVHWETDKTSWLLPGTPAFSTALVVYTLAQLDPASDILIDGVMYLMSVRQTNRLWGSSFESAWVLMALNEALKGTGDLQASFTFSSTLNEIPIAEGQAGGPNSLVPVNVSLPLNELHQDWPNALNITRSAGNGRLYYRTDLIVYRSANSAPPVNKGMNISRSFYLEAECGETCEAINSVTYKSGQIPPLVSVKLTLILPNDMYNVMIEDYIPSGSEIFDPNLLTSQQGISGFDYSVNDQYLDSWGWWYFSNPNIYDDHILWAAEYLPAGTYTLTYHIVPFQAGQFQVIPTRAWQFFFPEVQGSSAGNLFEIIKE